MPPDYNENHKALSKQLHLLLEVAWKTMAKSWPEGFGEGTRAALILILGFAMRRLCAVGFTTKEIVGIWDSVRSDPQTIKLQEQVQEAVAKAQRHGEEPV